MYELQAADLMSTDLITLDADETIDLAGEIMQLARIRHLPITSDGQLVGLITQRDLLRAQIETLAGLSTRQARAAQRSISAGSVMNRAVKSVEPDTPAVDAARLMRDNKFGCLPVVHDDRLVGIITEADFIDLVIGVIEAS